MRPKKNCEICGLENIAILHRHHVIPRQDPRSTNGDNNIAILCPNCHYKVHTGELIIIGVYRTTAGLNTIWFKNGEKPPFPKEDWLIKENPLIITLKADKSDLEE